MMKLGRKLIQEELRLIDKLIKDYRDKQMFTPKDFQSTTIKTKLGEIPIARRRYRQLNITHSSKKYSIKSRRESHLCM